MAKGNQTCNDFVKFISQATAMPSYGANLELHMHTGDPGDGGTGATFECAYTGYAPVLISRDAGGFTICDADGTRGLQFTERKGRKGQVEFDVSPAPILRKAA